MFLKQKLLMKNLLRTLFVISFFSFGFAQLFSQERIVQGIVYDSETKKPLINVNVSDNKSDSWAITDEHGNFQIKTSTITDLTLVFSVLKMENQEISLLDNQNQVSVYMNKKTLRLPEITVTANAKRKFSELTLGTEAINNVQSFSLDDVLTQLPGQITTDFNINKFKNLVFRTATNINFQGNLSSAAKQAQTDYFGNKAFGTAIVMNNIPLSNNENMQTYNPNSSTAFSTSYIGNFSYDGNTFNNTNYGVDLRELSTNNIEEVKVVQGIPSVKYGDLTSGLVLVTSKVGQTPFRAYVSLRDATTEANLTKGFQINKNNFMNLGFNYLNSKSDARNNLLDYQRITGTLAWKFNNDKKNITNTLNFSYRFNLDDAKANPDDITDEIVRNKKVGFSLSNNFKYRILNSWLDGINADLNLNYDRQLSRKKKWLNTGVSAATNSLEPGIHEAVLLPSQYSYVQLVEGIPISTYANVEFIKNHATKTKWVHNLSLGLSHRSSMNLGDGRKSDLGTLSNLFTLSASGATSDGFRDYNFKNTKVENQYSVYLEDKIFKKFKDDQTFNLEAGLRYDNQLGFSTWQPRVNTSFVFNKTFRIRAGYGISSKAPSLNQVYTGNRYIDRLVGGSIYIYPGVYQKAWIQTIISQGDNKNLVPTQSYKTEIGFDVNLPFALLNVTGYYNQLKKGISNQQKPESQVVDNAQVLLNGTNLPTLQINGTTTYNFFTNTLTNNLESEDTGVEMILNFKRIDALNLDVSINGSYTYTNNFANTKTYIESNNIMAPEIYGVFNPNTAKDELFTLGGNFTYHIPKIGLLISLRSEHILIQNQKNANSRFPNGYLDSNYIYHEIPVQDQQNEQLYGHLIQNDTSFKDKLQKTLHNFHLRVSKDFLNGFKASIYVNNFLNLKPYYYNNNNLKITYEIADFSFGGRLEYEF